MDWMQERPRLEPLSPERREFLDWVSNGPRTYAETMDAWGTRCPRHSVWEDALIEGLVRLESGETIENATVSLTPAGRSLLDNG
jgi:hypothetical protein